MTDSRLNEKQQQSDGSHEPKTRAYGSVANVKRIIQNIKRMSRSKKIDISGKILLFLPTVMSISIIVLIFTFLWIEAFPIFVAPEGGIGIITNPIWNPNDGQYGILVFIAGSFLCTILAISIAVPLGVGGAVFLSEYCPNSLRRPIRMIVEMMAAIPSIVYGLWAYLVLVPTIETIFNVQNGLSVLAGGLILAIMLLPTVVAVSDDALQSVPRTYREASLALGATKTETAIRVVLSAAIPGIGAAIILSLGRAVGETMAVLMVTGNTLQIPYTLFDPTYVMTSIITNQLGYAFIYPLWRSALFAVALVLLLMSIMFTSIAKILIKWGIKSRGLA